MPDAPAPAIKPFDLPETPGLFITATDTEVGKTVVTCAIAAAMARAGIKAVPCKPIGSGSAERDGRLHSPDVPGMRPYLPEGMDETLLCPVRYRQPLAPAVAAAATGMPVDYGAIHDALTTLADHADALLVEGIGGLLVPLDATRTLLDLAIAIDYPVLVVTRPDLGTLNHTALTCRTLRDAGLRLAGLVVSHGRPIDPEDASIATNADWLGKMNNTRVLATLPHAAGLADGEAPPEELINELARVDWLSLAQPSRT